MTPPYDKFQERVIQAAEAVLKRDGSVGPLELFQEMRWLQPVHFDSWRKGNEFYRVLEAWIQVGEDKFAKTIRHFREWAKQKGLRAFQADYTRRGPNGVESLRITQDGDPNWEQFYRTHYAPGDLSQKKSERLATKLKRAPELVVFEKVSDEGNCSECGAELSKGDHLLMEKSQPLCLTCADLDYLVFLPAGDAALTRRARKHSPLAAVVVRFNRTRKRYERQGLLVSDDAIAKAEAECLADAPERAVARTQAALKRIEADREFVTKLTLAISDRFPRCPIDEIRKIAAHTALRGSVRVGRSAAGRAMDASAIDLAVVAHIRHEHTDYDQLLMKGVERHDARRQVREKIDRVKTQWSTP